MPGRRVAIELHDRGGKYDVVLYARGLFGRKRRKVARGVEPRDVPVVVAAQFAELEHEDAAAQGEL